MIVAPTPSRAFSWTVPSGWNCAVLILPLLLLPGASVTVPTVRLELKPPPFAWVGGCSRTAPSRFTDAPQGFATLPSAVEVLGRRSAIPEGAGKVEISMTRNLVRSDKSYNKQKGGSPPVINRWGQATLPNLFSKSLQLLI